ncbi:hypothetical protein [Methanomethylovorans sp.]
MHERSLKERGLEEEDHMEAAEVIDDPELYKIFRLKQDTAIVKI